MYNRFDYHIFTNCFWQLKLKWSGTTDEDPTYRTIKLVTNYSTVAWTSYELTLSATGPVFTLASIDLFSSAVISNGGLKITFPNGIVNPGDEVMLNFKTLVSSVGPFTVTLTQNPIPEPATMTLLCMGALALIRRK
ncbi:MAG: PEP-CTERM sorting domain-containing protein [Phycisphaerales bacterium]